MARLIEWDANPGVKAAVKRYDDNDIDQQTMIDLGGSVAAVYAAVLEDQIKALKNDLEEVKNSTKNTVYVENPTGYDHEIHLCRHVCGGPYFYVFKGKKGSDFYSDRITREQLLTHLERFRDARKIFNVALSSRSIHEIARHE